MGRLRWKKCLYCYGACRTLCLISSFESRHTRLDAMQKTLAISLARMGSSAALLVLSFMAAC